MDSSILQFINGTPGYSPQGSKGNDGKNGYSIYYSSFGSDDISIEKIKSLINGKKVLSSNDNYMSDEIVEYRDHDMIMTNDASIFIISGIDDGNVYINHIGSIKKALRNKDTTPFSNDTSIGIIISNIQDTVQNYNYSVYNVASPLWHHRDANDSSMHGNTLMIEDVNRFKDKLNDVDGSTGTLVINFRDGLRYEKIITVSNADDGIFIENGYLYPYGNIDSSSIWSNPNHRFQTYDQERNVSPVSDTSTASQILRANLISKTPSRKLCDGYIEYYYKNQEYRIPLEIKEDNTWQG